MKKLLILLVLFMISGKAVEIEETFSAVTLAIDTIWIMVAGFMVFFMHAGFSTRSKNTIKIGKQQFVLPGLKELKQLFLILELAGLQ